MTAGHHELDHGGFLAKDLTQRDGQYTNAHRNCNSLLPDIEHDSSRQSIWKKMKRMFKGSLRRSSDAKSRIASHENLVSERRTPTATSRKSGTWSAGTTSRSSFRTSRRISRAELLEVDGAKRKSTIGSLASERSSRSGRRGSVLLKRRSILAVTGTAQDLWRHVSGSKVALETQDVKATEDVKDTSSTASAAADVHRSATADIGKHPPPNFTEKQQGRFTVVRHTINFRNALTKPKRKFTFEKLTPSVVGPRFRVTSVPEEECVNEKDPMSTSTTTGGSSSFSTAVNSGGNSLDCCSVSTNTVRSADEMLSHNGSLMTTRSIATTIIGSNRSFVVIDAAAVASAADFTMTAPPGTLWPPPRPSVDTVSSAPEPRALLPIQTLFAVGDMLVPDAAPRPVTIMRGTSYTTSPEPLSSEDSSVLSVPRLVPPSPQPRTPIASRSNSTDEADYQPELTTSTVTSRTGRQFTVQRVLMRETSSGSLQSLTVQ
ncbi:hypothetical protein DFJ77DRAFT_508841 [Powellomyces hirtus]|nr:hypothetical protein DFJ77DRAFT_508841 [Powellomyces hirtus]